MYMFAVRCEQECQCAGATSSGGVTSSNRVLAVKVLLTVVAVVVVVVVVVLQALVVYTFAVRCEQECQCTVAETISYSTGSGRDSM
jgi:hypothetical protein